MTDCAKIQFSHNYGMQECRNGMSQNTVKRIWKILTCLLGSAVLAFGLYHIHNTARITEGGVLGMTLLLQNWFHISPAVSGLILNILCYGFAFSVLGWGFLGYSFVSSVGFSLFYAIFESFDPLWPQIPQHPLLAAVAGAVFVGIGAGLSVRVGAASGGDDAFALAVSKKTSLEIQWVYLITDLIVLLLSLSYIPWRKILYSVITVILSGQLIGLIVKIPSPPFKEKNTEQIPRD